MSLSRPEWSVEGRDWPHREHSRFLQHGGIRWHVQIMGSGPPLLLLHGTGASSHSFRELMPLLAERFTVVTPDLPGHAFSTTPPRFTPSLPTIAAALRDLLAALDLTPTVAVGHSAGAALIARMALDGAIAPRLLIGLGAALLPFRGLVTSLFGPAARLLAQSALAPQLLALQASAPASVDRLLRSTGSILDPRGIDLYGRLARSPGHVAAVLAMLAGWDLAPLFAQLPDLQVPFLLLAGEADRAIPVGQARQVIARAPLAQLRVLPGVGHLMHEEQPTTVARLILAQAAST